MDKKTSDLFENVYMDEGDPNPCVQKYGRGPPGVKCKDCAYLAIKPTYSKNYYKCRVRGITSGAATDHRVSWNACGLFEESNDGKDTNHF